MTTPAEIMERLKGLPPHLAPTERRFWVEAVTDETKAPLIEYYRQVEAAEHAADVWAKAQGAESFYPPRSGPVYAFSFRDADAPAPGGAWNDAGRHYVSSRGCVAKGPSKRPAGKKLTAELADLPAFPTYRIAMDHLGAITDLRTSNGGGGVGYSDGKMHFAVPVEINGRYFINGVNHNYDIFRAAQTAAEYAGTENEKWGPCLDYLDDPIAWRPGPGWAFTTRVEVEFLIAEENMRRAAVRTAEAVAA